MGRVCHDFLLSRKRRFAVTGFSNTADPFLNALALGKALEFSTWWKCEKSWVNAILTIHGSTQFSLLQPGAHIFSTPGARNASRGMLSRKSVPLFFLLNANIYSGI